MAPEERMLERFTRERQRASKGDVFNLEDEEELTHYGQSLSKLDDFDNIGLGLEDEDEERGASCVTASGRVGCRRPLFCLSIHHPRSKFVTMCCDLLLTRSNLALDLPRRTELVSLSGTAQSRTHWN